jgi:hypothetical protein
LERFIEAAASLVRGDLFGASQTLFNAAILTPPYRKITDRDWKTPWIPQRNGFICRRDPVTSLPREVSDEPSPKEWGVYYWMRPHGCRIVVMGIGVLDPMEVGGCALWWSPKESSPLLSVRATREATPELREAMNRALKDTYLRVAQRWTKCTETSPASDSIQT